MADTALTQLARSAAYAQLCASLGDTRARRAALALLLTQALFARGRLPGLPALLDLQRASAAVAGDRELSALALPSELLDCALLPPACAELAALAGELAGLPHADLAPGALGICDEALGAPRRSAGRFFTPPAVARELARRALGDDPGQARPTICDPAMGGGAFLLAALDLVAPQRRRALAAGLYGVELDATTAAVARAAIGLALLDADGGEVPDLRPRLRAGDALLGAFPEEPPADAAPLDRWACAFPGVFAAGGFDVVVGNPPYIDSERMARDQPELRRKIARLWPSAAGNWDLFIPFVELGLRLLRPGGRCALLVPNRLLAATYARAARALLAEQQLEALLDFAAANLFGAGVYPVGYVVRRSPRHASSREAPAAAAIDVCIYEPGAVGEPRVARCHTAPAGSISHTGAGWGQLLSPYPGRASGGPSGTVALSDLAELREAMTVAEAYALAPLIEELSGEQLPPGYVRVVNTGTLDRYIALWGSRPMRYLGSRYLRPVLSIAAIHGLFPPQRRQVGQARLIIAGLSQRPEVYADQAGALFAAKSTVVLTAPDDATLWALLGLLNSQAAARLAAELYGGLALRGGYIRFGARQAAALPVPRALAERGALAAELAELARRRSVLSGDAEMPALEAQIDALVEELYRG